MTFQCVSRSHVGCRRKLNEDAVLCAPDLRLWAVADGMGGHEAGEVASALVVERLAAQPPDPDLVQRTVASRRALEQANVELIALAEEHGSGRTIGATVVLLAADEAGFACLWAGDSRAYQARDGALRQLTRDHSLVQELVDAGELDPREAATHPNANVIRRAVGASPALDLDFLYGELADRDTFLLASDGLTRLVDDEEILQGLQAADLAQAADAFLDRSLDRGAPDNVSLVLIRYLAQP